MPSFLFVDTGTFYPPQTIPIAPATGTTVRLSRSNYMIAGTATIAALTLQMPSRPYVGSRVTIFPNVAVTALTLQTATGGAIAGAPTAATAGKPITLMWTGTVWQAEVD